MFLDVKTGEAVANRSSSKPAGSFRYIPQWDSVGEKSRADWCLRSICISIIENGDYLCPGRVWTKSK